jgi:tetratricopeptide (TPR) repeat protein
MRGLAHCDKADYDSAVADFTKAIQRDKSYIAAYQNRARAYLGVGKYGLAVKDFTRVIEQKPGRADAFDGRAQAHCLKKQYDAAIADATEAIRLNPACATAYAHRSRAHAGKGELAQAVADATEAIKLDAQAAHYEVRGLAYHERGEYDLAIADFTDAIRLDPKNGALYRSRSRSYAKKGDSAKAEADKQKAIKFGASVGGKAKRKSSTLVSAEKQTRNKQKGLQKQSKESGKGSAGRYALRRRFWEGLLDRPKMQGTRHAGLSTTDSGWISAGSGLRGLPFVYVVHEDEGRVELYIDRGSGKAAENKAIFDKLLALKADVEKEFGAGLDWQRLDDKQGCRIAYTVAGGGYKSDEAKWPAIQDTMIDAMARLEKAFAPHLAKLKAELASEGGPILDELFTTGGMVDGIMIDGLAPSDDEGGKDEQ